mmetsp:Transcript_19630/g.49062  ORF Transcript_19630/g.49062 Transcript_19630/m.49062 type:complete len:93 (-) Transcript_19630:2-280(-)
MAGASGGNTTPSPAPPRPPRPGIAAGAMRPPVEPEGVEAAVSHGNIAAENGGIGGGGNTDESDPPVLLLLQLLLPLLQVHRCLSSSDIDVIL